MLSNSLLNLFAGAVIGAMGGFIGGLVSFLFPPAGTVLSEHSILLPAVLLGSLFGLAVAFILARNPLIDRDFKDSSFF